MAGNYPDVPDHRIAYDRDGSIGFWYDTSQTVNQYSQAYLQNLNDEDDSTTGRAGDANGMYREGVIFPEPRDIAGYFLAASASPTNLETSTDTTNGVDGTWTARGNPVNGGNSKPGYRNAIQSVNWPGVKGIRWRHAASFGPDNYVRMFAVYGSPSSGEAPDRLRIWHPTSDVEVAGYHFDFGDVPRAAVVSKTFRVKNPSATLTANDVTLSVEALSDTSPSNVSQYEFSDDGTNFSSTLNIGNLAPGATSGVITLRRTTNVNATLGIWTCRFVASAASYT